MGLLTTDTDETPDDENETYENLQKNVYYEEKTKFLINQVKKPIATFIFAHGLT